MPFGTADPPIRVKRGPEYPRTDKQRPCRFRALWIAGRSAVEAKSVGTQRIDVRGLGTGVVPVPTPQLSEEPAMSQNMSPVGLAVHVAQPRARRR